MNNNCKRPIFKKEEFWINDPNELYRDTNYLKFFPLYNSSRIEQLNAVTRFAIYFFFLILIFNMGNNLLYVPVTIIGVIALLYLIDSFDNQGHVKQLNKILDIRKTQRSIDDARVHEQLTHDGSDTYNLAIDPEEKEQTNYKVETGYYDADNKLIIGDRYSAYTDKDDKENQINYYSVDELENYKRNTCRRPSVDNPFMNPSVADFNNGDVPVACNSFDEDINDNMIVNFNDNLFRDVDEVWERENSQRQFYTVPNTAVPNQQTEFANWLYKVPATCKENNTNGECLRYDDLRNRRR